MPDAALLAEQLGLSVIAVLVIGGIFYLGYKKLCGLKRQIEEHEREGQEYRRYMREEVKEIRHDISDVKESVARMEGTLNNA